MRTMTRAAIYARYSTDKQRQASIADQVRNCARYASEQDWTVDKHYKDEAISGSRADRPGYRQLLAAAKARAFDVVLVDDLSRLSRDDVELKLCLRRLRYWGIRIIGVSDGLDSLSKGYKLHAGIRGLINDIYLDDLREKTHRGLAGQALKGFNTGGRCYGYLHVPIEDATRKDEHGRPLIVAVKRKVKTDEAEWVRQIFTWYADGHPPRWIAAELNRRGVPSPRGTTWAASAIYGDMRTGTGLLNNELYIGRYVWNRSYWTRDPDNGRRRRVPRSEHEWIVTELPDLRIVPQTLWDSVKARQRTQQQRSAAIRSGLHNRARTGAGPKYLFSSLLKCGCCGANYVIVDRYRYGCSTNVNRGEAACENAIRVPRELVEAQLLEGIKRDLFTPEAVALFQQEVNRLVAERRSTRRSKHAKIQRRLTEVEREIGNIVEAIKAGVLTPTTKAELEKAEAEKGHLQAALNAKEQPVPARIPDLTERYIHLVRNLEETLEQDVPRARTQIQALLGDKICLHPNDDGYLEAEIVGDYLGLINLINEDPGDAAGASELSLVAGACNNQAPTLFRNVRRTIA